MSSHLIKSSTIAKMVAEFKSRGNSALHNLTESQLSKLIRAANEAYYQKHLQILTDNEYDILCNYTIDNYPQNTAAQEGHKKTKIPEKNKVTLPYEMWSMDKIKPDTDALEKWKKTYNGPYVLSCKLDGVSGLYSTEGPNPKLYTRGNGYIGQDISHIIPYLNLPSTENITLRGEFIIKKTVFTKKYSNEFANPRNFVAGVINQKTPDPMKCKDLDFVIYEVLKPDIKPSLQMEYLFSLKMKCPNTNIVKHYATQKLSNQLLSELLIKWRAEYEYEIDGVICINNKIYPRQTGNPAHAFAFKMVLSDQIAEAKVVDVLWTPSKDGYLKPRVKIEPIHLSGVKIEYTTGFNAKFIQDNCIGIGTIIRLTRSGDVIPHINAVIQSAAQPKMPEVPYVWNATKVDILLENKNDDTTVKEKNITLFFTSLEVDGIGAGNVKKIMAAGFDTVAKIIEMTELDFLKVDGFKEKMATKIKHSITEKIKKVSLAELMHATNIFGRGFGTKKFQLILKAEPRILLDTKMNFPEKIQRVSMIEGMATKTAEQFINRLPDFLLFLAEINLQHKLNDVNSRTNVNNTIIKAHKHPLLGQEYIMTGFRDKHLIERLAQVGAEQGNSVKKTTIAVLVKNINENTSKTQEAKRLGIPVLSIEQFIMKYKL